MGARRPDRPPLNRWTPDFSQLRSEPFQTDAPTALPPDLHRRRSPVRHPRRLRPAGTRPRTRVIVRPRPPRAEVTIRSLTGTWVAVWQTPDAPRGARRFRWSRAEMRCPGRLVVQSRALASDPARPAHLDVVGQFGLGFGQAQEIVVVRGRPDVDRRPYLCVDQRFIGASRRGHLPPPVSAFTWRTARASANQADQRAARRAGSQVLQRVAADDAGGRHEQSRVRQLAAFRDDVEHERGQQRAPVRRRQRAEHEESRR